MNLLDLSRVWGTWLRTASGRKGRQRRQPDVCSIVHAERLEDRALLSASTSLDGSRWVINGDLDPAQPGETIIVEQSPTDTNSIRVTINGSTLAERSATGIRSLVINAGEGDDTVRITLPETFGRLSITVNGENGDDVLEAGDIGAVLNGGAGDDILTGGVKRDRLNGNDGSDILNGLGGDDALNGGRGNDTLRGGSGSNRLAGGRGQDWLYYTPGIDRTRVGSTDHFRSSKTDLQKFDSEEAFQEWLAHAAAQNVKLNLGGFTGGPIVDFRDGIVTQAITSQDGASESSSHSDTNTQVNGVDEQDIIETDGDFVYVARGDELLIIDVRLPEDANVISRTKLTGWGSEMYLDGDRLTIISTVNNWYFPTDFLTIDDTTSASIEPGTLRLANSFAIPRIWNWHPQTEIISYDISDRATPKVVESTRVDGRVTTSRSIDGRIFLVVENYLSLPQPDWSYLDAVKIGGVGSWVQETAASYQDRLAKFDFTTLIPSYTTTSYDAAGNASTITGKLLNGTDVWAPDDPVTSTNVVTILMIDIHDGDVGVDSTSSLFGVSGEVYASTSSLYIASQDWSDYRWDGRSDQGPKTNLYKFNLSAEGTSFAASGTVDGTIIDQFAMDESSGDFRIATTSNAWQTQQSSNVFVLRQQGDSLITVSSLTGLSPTERIYSARFVGDQLYMSTFLIVDPLLSVNLSDPLNPVLSGQLEVPGFSSYLQAWGDDFLVSIGQDADPTTGRVTGLQLSLFNVSDIESPELVGTYKIGVKAWDSYSQAQWDHHAFSLFSEEGLLAIPVSYWDAEEGFSSSLDVFQLDPETGFDLLGQIDHNSAVVRSLIIDGNLVSMSYDELRINGLFDLEDEVSQVDLTSPPAPVVEPAP